MTAAEPVLRWLVDGSLAATAAVLLVLALRHPLRHAFGARVAYGAWALVPLALLAAALPRPRVDQVLAPQFLALHPGMFVVAGQGAANEGLAAGGVDWPPLPCVPVAAPHPPSLPAAVPVPAVRCCRTPRGPVRSGRAAGGGGRLARGRRGLARRVVPGVCAPPAARRSFAAPWPATTNMK